MKSFFLVACVCLSAAGLAQTPNITVGIDWRPTLIGERGGNTRFRWYDALGRPSLLLLGLDLELGWRIKIAERLQKVRNESEQELLDEAYLEDPGVWRVGKQVLPFGRGILRETVYAARLNTHLVIDQLPISIAIADAGKRRQRGFTARIGSRLGLSLAIGNHFGIASGSLTCIRLPEDSLGAGRGYRQVIGLDYLEGVGAWQYGCEFIWLRQPDTTLDREESVSDLRVSYRDPLGRFRLLGGWARAWQGRADFYRIEGEIPLDKNLWLVPILKFDRGDWRGLSVTARVRF